MRRVVAFFSAAAITGLVGVSACSSAGGVAAGDAGGATGGEGGRPLDAGKGSTGPGVTGKVCTTDKDCTGGVCSSGYFDRGTLNPTAYCMMEQCDITDPTAVESCDQDRGICMGIANRPAGKGLCFAGCQFNQAGISEIGRCPGKNDCQPIGYALDEQNKPLGVGICYGGCGSDADCTSGDKCQVERRLCVRTLETFSKANGEACTEADDKAGKCDCLLASKGPNAGKGYCSTTCLTGGTACPAGFLCSSASPSSDSSSPPKPLFTAEIPGIGGRCLKPCAAQADCDAISTKCREVAGGKFCLPSST